MTISCASVASISGSAGGPADVPFLCLPFEASTVTCSCPTHAADSKAAAQRRLQRLRLVCRHLAQLPAGAVIGLQLTPGSGNHSWQLSEARPHSVSTLRMFTSRQSIVAEVVAYAVGGSCWREQLRGRRSSRFRAQMHLNNRGLQRAQHTAEALLPSSNKCSCHFLLPSALRTARDFFILATAALYLCTRRSTHSDQPHADTCLKSAG